MAGNVPGSAHAAAARIVSVVATGGTTAYVHIRRSDQTVVVQLVFRGCPEDAATAPVADVENAAIATVAKVKDAAIATVAKVKNAAIATAAKIRVVDCSKEAPVAPVARVDTTVAPTAQTGGPKHATIAQIFVGFLPDAQVLRRKLPVGTQDGSIEHAAFHAGPRRAERRPLSRNRAVQIGRQGPNGGFHAGPRPAEGNPPRLFVFTEASYG